MKTIYYTSILLVTIIVLFFSCLRDNMENQLSNTDEIKNGLTIDEAKAFFESQMSITTRANNNLRRGLTPGDFTPCWDKVKTSHDEKVSNVDVPILPQYRYKAMRCDMTNGTARAYTVNITQKMVVSKNRSTNKLGQYLVTLIPDRTYYNKNRGDISAKFISCGNKDNFSGWVIYSLPQNRIPIKVEKYSDGKKCIGIVIPAAKGRSQITKQTLMKIMGDIVFAVSQSVQTRSFGEYDSFQDWFEEEVFPDAEDGDYYTMEHDDDGWYLEDQYGDRNDIPDDLMEDDDIWMEDETTDDSEVGMPESGDSNFPEPEFNPAIRIYHKVCGTFLGTVQWDDWKGYAITYCPVCKMSVYAVE